MDHHNHPHAAEGGSSGKCPFTGGMLKNSAGRGTRNRDWWPNQLQLSILRMHSSLSNPMEPGFNYAEAFNSLDLNEVKNDINQLMTQSQDWWPADYGHYGPLSLEWHGTAQVLIAFPMVAVELVPELSVLLR